MPDTLLSPLALSFFSCLFCYQDKLMNFLALELNPKSFSVTRCQATTSVHLKPIQQRRPAQPTRVGTSTHVWFIRKQGEGGESNLGKWKVSSKGAGRGRVPLHQAPSPVPVPAHRMDRSPGRHVWARVAAAYHLQNPLSRLCAREQELNSWCKCLLSICSTSQASKNPNRTPHHAAPGAES